MTDIRVSALCEAIAQLLEGYAELARRLPEFDPPPEVEQALLGPLRSAAENAAALLTEAAA